MTPLAPKLVYILCLCASLLCALLLSRAWWRSRQRLLFWCAVSFGFLAINNLLLVADLVVFPTRDLWAWRQAAAGLAVATLLFGFIWEEA